MKIELTREQKKWAEYFYIKVDGMIVDVFCGDTAEKRANDAFEKILATTTTPEETIRTEEV